MIRAQWLLLIVLTLVLALTTGRAEAQPSHRLPAIPGPVHDKVTITPFTSGFGVVLLGAAAVCVMLRRSGKDRR
jgi:hypothetical protein